MTLGERSVLKAELMREIARLRTENDMLKARAFRPLSKTAATYLRVLSKVYGPEAWTTPACVHLAALDVALDYEAKSASGSAIATLEERGYIERRGSALRVTQSGMADEAVTSVTVLGVVAS